MLQLLLAIIQLRFKLWSQIGVPPLGEELKVQHHPQLPELQRSSTTHLTASPPFLPVQSFHATI